MLLGKVEGPPVLNGKIGRAAVEAVGVVARSLPTACGVRVVSGRCTGRGINPRIRLARNRNTHSCRWLAWTW